MKRMVSILLCIAIVVMCSYASAEIESYRYESLPDGTICITDLVCSGKSIEIPETIDGFTVTQIKARAIRDSDAETVSFPNTITLIDGNPFEYLTSKKITTIRVAVDHPYLAVIDGGLFSKPDKKLIFLRHDGERELFQSASYAVPNGIEIIGASASEYHGGLASVTIPSSVKTIEENAFNCNTQLRNVTFETPSNLIVIEYEAFSECGKLSSVTLPEGLRTIGGCAFYHCPNLGTVYLPNTVSEIGGYAFAKCSSLRTLNLPDSVEYLGAGLVSESKIKAELFIPRNVKEIEGGLGIASISVDPDNEFFMVMDGFLITKDKTRLVQQVGNNRNVEIPSYIKTIGNRAFMFDEAVRTIVISEGVEIIEDGAFWCDSITTITLPKSVSTIGINAFGYKPKLTLIVEAGSYAEEYAQAHNIKYTYNSNTDWLSQ